MKILIHRGSNEIGGTCIEIATKNTKILLDVGQPLNDEPSDFKACDLKPDAVLVSHPHQDHYGLMDTLDAATPVYLGDVGKDLINAVRMFIGKKLPENNFRPIQSKKTFEVGDFKVKPFLVDHSAVDAYAFLIEAEGKRIFYSGDFRATGRKAILFQNILRHPPKDIDVLFMEGTMIGRSNEDFPDEKSVERKIYETIRKQTNISFLVSSAQTIDRIVSAYRASKRAGKTLIIDAYTARVLECLKKVSEHVPNMSWPGVRVFVAPKQYEAMKKNRKAFGNFFTDVFGPCRIKYDEISRDTSKYLFPCRMSFFKDIEKFISEEKINVIYSQWLGYLNDDKNYGAKELRAWKEGKDPGVNFVYAHTSGHATLDDLKRFAEAINPKMLVPVHTENKGSFENYFNNVVLLDDSKPFIL